MKSHMSMDLFLAICDRNMWLLTAKYDISSEVNHIRGKGNVIKDLVHTCVLDPVPHHTFYLDFHIYCMSQYSVHSTAGICISQGPAAFIPSTAASHVRHFKTFLSYLGFMDLRLLISLLI